jgi:hypothetical protein
MIRLFRTGCTMKAKSSKSSGVAGTTTLSGQRQILVLAPPLDADSPAAAGITVSARAKASDNRLGERLIMTGLVLRPAADEDKFHCRFLAHAGE